MGTLAETLDCRIVWAVARDARHTLWPTGMKGGGRFAQIKAGWEPPAGSAGGFGAPI